MQATRPSSDSALSSIAREVFTVRWAPKSETLFALASYLLVVAALYLAFQVFTTEQVALNFITFGPVTLALLGVAVPIAYTVAVRRRPISDLGISTKHAVVSLLIGAALGVLTYLNTLATIEVLWSREIIPIITMALAVGFFEAVFFRGWLQLRLEEAFGLLPGIMLGAVCYSLYHVGYGMEVGELLTLFVLGLTFATAFRLTRNILVLWPLYTPVGGLYANLQEGLTMPFPATYGFIIVLVLYGVVVVLAGRVSRSRPVRNR